jgi:hypothetical protein
MRLEREPINARLMPIALSGHASAGSESPSAYPAAAYARTDTAAFDEEGLACLRKGKFLQPSLQARERRRVCARYSVAFQPIELQSLLRLRATGILPVLNWVHAYQPAESEDFSRLGVRAEPKSRSFRSDIFRRFSLARCQWHPNKC